MSITGCYTIINIFSRKNVNIFKANLAIFLISSFGSMATTIEALAYKNLLKHLEIEIEEMQCFIRDHVFPDEEVLRKYGEELCLTLFYSVRKPPALQVVFYLR